MTQFPLSGASRLTSAGSMENKWRYIGSSFVWLRREFWAFWISSLLTLSIPFLLSLETILGFISDCFSMMLESFTFSFCYFYCFFASSSFWCSFSAIGFSISYFSDSDYFGFYSPTTKESLFYSVFLFSFTHQLYRHTKAVEVGAISGSSSNYFLMCSNKCMIDQMLHCDPLLLIHW